MRPDVLFPLFAPVTSLPGIGPRFAKLFAKLVGEKVIDLCWHRPTGIIDRRFSPKLADAPEGGIVTLTVTVGRHKKPPSTRLPYKIRCSDETGTIDLVFFNAKPDYLAKALPEGETRVVSGRVERYGGELQMTHPDYIATPDEIGELQRVEPVYPLTAGLTPKPVGRAVRAAVERAPALPEWLDPAYRTRRGWAGWQDSLRALHAPETLDDLLPDRPTRARLAYDELLANQIALALVRLRQKRRAGRRLAGDGSLRTRLVAALPYRLTQSQSEAVEEIARDMADPAPMLRLLQGDVGSGKTVVALLAMAVAAEAGAQAALLAPTEILARQHFATIEPLARAAEIEVALLTGRDRGKARAETLAGLVDGRIRFAVGTHALLQEDVEFQDLGLAVIDEQHRFGVHQRLLLAEKGHSPDVLVMTATPIPRTLMMTAYGDLETSRLTEKPAGRRPIDTRTLPLERLEAVVAGVERAVRQGARVYWICPLVQESEAIDLANAEARAAELKRRLGLRIGLVHGQQKAAERDAAMAAFAGGEIDLLVATTVVEVGVDVPAATVMVIEHAERFGLAQLHQLRGRIGRSDKPSTCLLLYQAPLGQTAKSRLEIMRETDDGFRIAEEDLKLRGAGELLGTRQSGLPDFRLADLAAHGELLAAARDDAKLVLDKDPDLASPRGAAIRTLLYLFERDAVVKTVRSG